MPTAIHRIDFNCDLGEGCADDAAIAPWISSASLACGAHAGDADTLRMAVALCRDHGVAIGAHPSFVDRDGFGRREQALAPGEVRTLVAGQVATVRDACAAAGAALRHVKPHGALYNLAARDPATAAAVADGVRDVDPALRLYALAGSALVDAGATAGLRVVQEAFAERRYEADGRLSPRDLPGASIDDLDAALAQLDALLRTGGVTARTGETVAIRADSLCLHGDRAGAATFARGLHAALSCAGVRIAAPGDA